MFYHPKCGINAKSFDNKATGGTNVSRNQQLDGLLAKINELAQKAREEKDFQSIFPLLREFNQTVGPIRYDNSGKWKFFSAIAALGGGFALYYFNDLGLQERLGDGCFVVLGVFAVILIGTLVAIGTANSGIDEVSDLIFNKDVYFDNQLKQAGIEGKKKEQYHQFKEEFGDFRDRGDEDRYIDYLANGAWAGQEHSFRYDYYVFHYVEVWYETVNHYDSKGNFTHSTQEKRTRTCYRYGLVLNFPYAKGLVLQSGGGSYDYPEGFKPTSQDFTDTFAVGAVSELQAAKFLKPAVVLACVELAKHFGGLNIDISRKGRLNIAFSDSDVLDLERKFSIAKPDEFEQEIKSHLDLPKLKLLLQFAETLMKYNDSNF